MAGKIASQPKREPIQKMATINYAQARETMVEQQVRPWDVLDARVLDVLATVPRDAFVPAAHRALAYADLQLPLGHGQVMLKPVVEGRMLQALELAPTDSVLEIGTGSGFISACLGRLAREVLSLELHADLAEAARARLAEHDLGGNVRIQTADAMHWDAAADNVGEHGFDAICVTGAIATLPSRFAQWLRPGGRMFIVHGLAPAMEAIVVRREGDDLRTQSQFETDLPYLVGAAPVPRFQL